LPAACQDRVFPWWRGLSSDTTIILNDWMRERE
jgi:hypothetical protein